jgi:hypothetical protein
MRSTCCLCVSLYMYPPIEFWMAWPIFMRPRIYITAPETIPIVYFLNPSHQCVCVCECVSICVSLLLLLGKGSVKCIPLFIARQRVGENVPAATNTRRIFGPVSLCVLLSLLRNRSVKTFPRQRRIVADVVFYAVRVVSKESGWLVLPRTSCLM